MQKRKRNREIAVAVVTGTTKKKRQNSSRNDWLIDWKKKRQKELPEPGVDPGSSEPQSDILPLNYSGFTFSIEFYLIMFYTERV